jgi:hypothetical protein
MGLFRRRKKQSKKVDALETKKKSQKEEESDDPVDTEKIIKDYYDAPEYKTLQELLQEVRAKHGIEYGSFEDVRRREGRFSHLYNRATGKTDIDWSELLAEKKGAEETIRNIREKKKGLKPEERTDTLDEWEKELKRKEIPICNMEEGDVGWARPWTLTYEEYEKGRNYYLSCDHSINLELIPESGLKMKVEKHPDGYYVSTPEDPEKKKEETKSIPVKKVHFQD